MFELATIYRNLKKYNLALDYCKQILKTEPDYIKAIYLSIKIRQNICNWDHFDQDILFAEEMINDGNESIGPFAAKIFFNDPSLQGAIFPGIEEINRLNFLNDYKKIYQEKPIRTATIPYDLLGIVSYMINQEMTIGKAYDLLDNSQIKFDGIDGKFSFIENVIFRELDILKIAKGNAFKLN